MFVVEEAHSLTLAIFNLYDRPGTHAGPGRYTAECTIVAHACPKHGCLETDIGQVAGALKSRGWT